jgi:hypothetical protein
VRLLHDTVADTDTTLEEMERKFGAAGARAVVERNEFNPTLAARFYRGKAPHTAGRRIVADFLLPSYAERCIVTLPPELPVGFN